MSDLKKAAEDYGKRYENWGTATQAFLDGAAWQREQDALFVEHFPGREAYGVRQEIAYALRAQPQSEEGV